MDFTIRLKAEGTDQARAQAEAVKSVRTELEKVQKSPQVKAKVDAAKGVKQTRDKSLLELAEDAQKASKALAVLQAQKAALNKGSVVNIATARNLDARIAGAQADVSRTQRTLIRRGGAGFDLAAAKAQAKEQEKSEIAKIDPRSAMSNIDKAKERAENQKKAAAKAQDKERAESIDPSKALGETQKTVKEKFYRPLMIGAALVGASLTGAMVKMAPLALGYMGMARLSMVSQVASFNMRRLFMGTNPKPLLDAIQRTGQLLDPRTFTGDKLGAFLRRTADGIMGALAKAEPYVRLFFKGMLLGALQAEGTWLKFRIAIQPVLNLLPKAVGHMLAVNAGVMVVKGGLALLGLGAVAATYSAAAMAATFVRAGLVAGGQLAMGAVRGAGALLSFGRAALVATGPLLPLVAAIGALALAYKQASDLKKQWDENSGEQIKNKLKADLGLTSEQEASDAMAKRQGVITGDDYDKKHGLGKYAPKTDAQAAPVPKGADKQALPAGQRIGQALADGMIAGMKAGEAKAADGGSGLVKAAEGGAKTFAEIRSPARRWRREIGMQLGAGAALGLDDSADMMASSAAAMMPSAPTVGSSALARAGVIIQQIGPFFGMPAGREEQVRRWVFDAVDDAAERLGALA